MHLEKHTLDSLRQTILKHEWKLAYETTSKLFAKNIPQSTILVANQLMKTHLRFHTHYNVSWIASFTQEIIHLEQRIRDEVKFPIEANGTFADAPYGVTDLVGGVRELWMSIMVASQFGEKAKHLSTALNGFIIAELCNYWDIVHPDELQYSQMFWDAPTADDGKKILPDDIDKAKMYRGIEFRKQPESLGYHSARLLGIVDEIEWMLTE